jgi:hypothetical protein
MDWMTTLGVLEILLEEVVQKRPDYGDRAECANILPRRRYDAADNIRGELELESEEQPQAESPPDRLALTVCGARRDADSEQFQKGFQGAEGDDDHRGRLGKPLANFREAN